MAATHRHWDWATLAGFGSILLWSTSVALSRRLSEALGPLGAGATVFGFSGILSLLYIEIVRPRETLGILRGLATWRALACGFLFVLYSLSYYLAMGLAQDRLQAIEISLLNYVWPAMTVLFSLWLLPVRASWFIYPGMTLAMTGVVLAQTSGGRITWASFAGNLLENPVAYLGGLSAGLTWALYSVLTRRWGADSGNRTPVFLLATGILLALMRPAFAEHAIVLSRRTIIEAVAMALFTALAYVWWDVAMRRGKVVIVASVSYATPLLSVLVSCAYLAVAPDPRVWFAGAMIVAGSLASGRAVRSSTRPL